MVFLCLLLHTPLVFAQTFDEASFALLTTRDGLSDNRITGMVQDEFGYLWIATAKGLNRYDGTRFLTFYSDTSQVSLPEDHIQELQSLSPHLLGASTASGFHVLDPRTLSQSNWIVQGDTGPASRKVNAVQAFTGDGQGGVLLLTSTGFYHMDSTGGMRYRYDYFSSRTADTTEVPFGRYRGIFPLTDDLYLVSTNYQHFVYRVHRHELHPLDMDKTLPAAGLIGSEDRPRPVRSTTGNFKAFAIRQKSVWLFDFLEGKANQVDISALHNSFSFDWRSDMVALHDTTLLITDQTRGLFRIRYARVSGQYVLEGKRYLSGFQCKTVFMDREGRLWIGTDKGLLAQRLSTGGIEMVKIGSVADKKMASPGIQSVTAAGDRLFVGTTRNGIYVLDRQTMSPVTHLSLAAHVLSADQIMHLLPRSPDSIYAATVGPLIGIGVSNLHHREISLPDWDKDHDWVGWQHLDARGNHYVTRNAYGEYYFRAAGTTAFQLIRHHDPPLVQILMPRVMAEDAEGNIWFGGHGLARLQAHTGQVDILLDSFPAWKTPRNEITALATDQNGTVYFGVRNSGLVTWDVKRKQFHHVTRQQGLPDHNIRALHFHGPTLWIGMESGLASYSPLTGKVSAFGVSDGMPDEPFVAYSFYYDTLYSHLYAGYNETLVRFNPDELHKSEIPPQFFIESLALSDTFILHHPREDIVLPAKNNSFAVHLGAINFRDPWQQQFAYRLVQSGDESWTDIGTQRSIIFSNLPAGRYRLQVKAYTKDNSWMAQLRELRLTIRPPFWQTSWFGITGIASLLLIMYLFYRFRIHAVRQKLLIDRQLSDLKMKGIHSQMNPHFIFNALNSIKEMVLTGDQKQASRYLSRFAQLIRINLEHSQQAFISVRQCIDYIEKYLQLECTRFDDLEYRIDVSDGLAVDDFMMPPMLVQPLVENAIWHGVSRLPGVKRITVRFYSRDQHLHCEIEDNGVGYLHTLNRTSDNYPRHQSLGIRNIRENLSLLNEKYGLDCALTLTDKSTEGNVNTRGTIAHLRLSPIDPYL